MALNIKNERVSQLAQELANVSGESLTDAVGHAIEAQLAQLHRNVSRHGLAERLIAIGRKCASQAPDDWRTRDFDDELYDEHGMPK
jgi:antitoxin VapB